MPISPITLQRRQAELGRIRLGQKEATGNGKTRPAKLDRFRFTSVSEPYIRDLAELYGGTPQPWDNNGIKSWEVITEATTIPVIVVKGGLSQWMETWSGGGCAHRCDGQQQVDGTPCDPQDRNHINAKPTTRLSVMLPELEAIGVFRMETHGWNAAAEIPAVAELAQFVGELVPANLHLVERRAVKDGKTSRFVVPVLDLQIGAAKLREVVAAKSGIAELDAAPAGATGAAAITAARPDYEVQVADATTVEEVRGIWRSASAAGHLDEALKSLLTLRGKEVEPDAPSPAQAEPDEDGAYEAEVVPDPQDLWQQCMALAGQIGMSLWDVETLLKSEHDVAPFDATADDLADLLRILNERKAA